MDRNPKVNEDDASVLVEGAPTVPSASLSGRIGWILIDSARGPYASLITLFVFSAYFATVVVPDPVRGQALWSYASSIAALLIAVGAPVVGAIADVGGTRKPWIAASVAVGVPCMALLWVATPAMTTGLGWVVLGLVGGAASIEYAAIFYNAMLPNIVPRAQIGLLSGLGLAASSVANIVVLLFYLYAWTWSAHPLFGLDPLRHEPERAVGPMAALWWLIFALPLFFFTPDSPSTRVSKREAIRQGFHNLAQTLPKLRRHRNATRFLIARMVFNEGFIVMMMLTGIYAAGILHWSPQTLTIQGLINCVCAVLAGLSASWLDAVVGSRWSTFIFVSGALIANAVLATLTPTSVLFMHVDPVSAAGSLFPTLSDKILSATLAATATFVTAGFASSRALVAKLSPPAMLNEFFGLYALSGTATSFFGPLAIGVATTAFQSQRAGVLVGMVFLIIGLALLLRVREVSVDVGTADFGN
jgi:UMF1 family MFS transporter